MYYLHARTTTHNPRPTHPRDLASPEYEAMSCGTSLKTNVLYGAPLKVSKT